MVELNTIITQNIHEFIVNIKKKLQNAFNNIEQN